MSLIEKLTAEQTGKLAEYREKWLRIGLATGPCDRPKMEKAVDELYGCFGLAPPEVKIWLESPLKGVMTAAVFRGIGATQMKIQLRNQLWNQVGDQVEEQLRNEVWEQLGDQLRNEVWEQVRDQVGEQLLEQVEDQLYSPGYGLHDAYWLGYYEFLTDVCKLEFGMEIKCLYRLSECGWWWPFKDFVIMTERPSELHRDAKFRLHHPSRAALSYPDGFGVWAWHGIRMPRLRPMSEIGSGSI